MRRVLFAALLLAEMCLGAPAQAFWPLDAVTGILSAPFGAPQYSYHRYHGYRRYGHFQHAPSEVARRASPESAAVSEAGGAEAFRPGRWELSAELAASSPGTASAGKGGLTTTRTLCINATNVVPVELGPQCRLDNTRRDGPSITWSMSCSNARDTVRSDGTAQYHGETMEATVVSHLPGANGTVREIPQRITGRYLGPCLRSTQAAAAARATPPGSGGSTNQAEPQGQSDGAAQTPPPAGAGSGAKPAAKEPAPMNPNDGKR
jgi:hypothetical protein